MERATDGTPLDRIPDAAIRDQRRGRSRSTRRCCGRRADRPRGAIRTRPQRRPPPPEPGAAGRRLQGIDGAARLGYSRIMQVVDQLAYSHAWRRIRLAAAATLALGVASFFAAQPWLERQLLVETERRGELFRSTLDQALSRFRHLTMILHDDPQVIGAFYGVGVPQTNERLAEIAGRAGLDALYLVGPDGVTIAASNYAQEPNFIGENYGFRPYFQAAMRAEQGALFAIGATTRKPGYFIADGVRAKGGDVIGAVAVKIDLAPLAEQWARSGELVFVSDADGVVILSSNPALRYRTLGPLPDARRAALESERRFGDEPLAPLDWQAREGGRAALFGTLYQHAAIPLEHQGWVLHFLQRREQVTERAWLVTAIIVCTAGAMTLLALTFRAARVRAALAASQKNRRALMAANAELRRAQVELQRSSKLAALGQLSASVTHELGQPISALRNYVAMAELSDPKNRLIEPVGRIVTRMEALTRQLRFFAARPPEAHVPLDLRAVARDAMALVRHDAEAAGATVALAPGAPAMVSGDALRLEQVLVNLLRNAVSAVEGAARREIEIETRQDGRAVRLSLRDTGPGLGGRSFETLAEPFHTTRDSGTGMGLGLAISAEIVREHGGRIAAADRPGGGAEFTVTLPAVEDEDAAEERDAGDRH